MSISTDKISCALQIGRSGTIGIVDVDGPVVTFAAFVGLEEMEETNETVAGAIASSFGSESEPKIELIGQQRRCVFKKNFGGPIRDPQGVMFSVQRCFVYMMDRLADSAPPACG